MPIGRYRDEGHGAHVTFGRFLSESCHSYMFALGADALRREPGFDPARCDGKLGDVLGASSSQKPALMGPFGAYRWLFGANPDHPEVVGHAMWDRGLWNPLAKEIEDHANEGGFGCPLTFGESFAQIRHWR